MCRQLWQPKNNFIFVHFYRDVLHCLVRPCVKWSLTGGLKQKILKLSAEKVVTVAYGGGRSREVSVWGFDWGHFWCFGSVFKFLHSCHIYSLRKHMENISSITIICGMTYSKHLCQSFHSHLLFFFTCLSTLHSKIM